MKKLYYFIAFIVILIINIILFFFIENIAYIVAIELPIFTACIIIEIINLQNKLNEKDDNSDNKKQD